MNTPPARLMVFLARIQPFCAARWACTLILVAPVLAQQPVRKQFNIPAGDATVTLPRFVEQSGEQLAYLVDNVRGEKTSSVTGRFNTRQALEHMLAGTNLIASQ